MQYLLRGNGTRGSMQWRLRLDEHEKADFLIVEYSRTYTVDYPFGALPTRHEVLEDFKTALSDSDVIWLRPQYRDWILDLDRLRSDFAEISKLDWIHGRVSVEPDVEIGESQQAMIQRRQMQWIEQQRDVQMPKSPLNPDLFDSPLFYESKVIFRIVPETVKSQIFVLETPVEIQHSLERFRLDLPEPEKAAFIIMRFGETKAHTGIFNGVKNALGAHGIEAVRANDKQYHDDLFNNVLTYMHGCGFAIAVYERIEEESFNPNISLEVGYMLALRKPVCILKDRTLKTLHSDIMGKLYRAFDPLDPAGTIPNELTSWLRDKDLVS